MKGKQLYRISKVDTRIYVKGFSGVLVYKALYAILSALGGFVLLYLLTSPYIAILVIVPILLMVLYRLNWIQQTLGPDGYRKRQSANKLPDFITIKQAVNTLIQHNQ
ncbi:DUF4133 domain-containing protein [Carboxylicivirga marina]|uniref:DUF4133 domain-containing protein n=1 Tax=Carboxylicivirga marina TaxID=2800988 RepID=A0ABS1HM68_9BACT|nr:DUF4133 domain-containing protein [Carboxylicivirga marina]MBK3518254.1 DUF4133 domain-containing protein [Carboxylicivirga marina]